MPLSLSVLSFCLMALFCCHCEQFLLVLSQFYLLLVVLLNFLYYQLDLSCILMCLSLKKLNKLQLLQSNGSGVGILRRMEDDKMKRII